MDYRNIEITKIKYFHGNLYFNDNRVLVSCPIMECYSPVQKYFDKYEFKFLLDLNNPEQKGFYHFIKSLEENNKLHTNHLAEYKSQLSILTNDKCILNVKVPFRYDRYEVNVEGRGDKYMTSLDEIVKGDMIKPKIQMTKTWCFSNKGKLMSGCIMELKEVYVLGK